MFDIAKLCENVKTASLKFAACPTAVKNAALVALKAEILKNIDKIKEVNISDVEYAKSIGQSASFIDRLTVTDKSIKTMCQGIDDVIALPDYVGIIDEEYTLPNGLLLQKRRAPLGVVGIIYEARPNVTIDAAVLCVKSGNGAVLKGGKDALNTNRFLSNLMAKAFERAGLPANLIGFVDSVERCDTEKMLKQSAYIDVVIPRGGETLKKYVVETAAMPVLASSGGNCHIYVDKDANLDMALTVVENAKISRPSVCNAVETLLVHSKIAAEFLPRCIKNLQSKGVEIRGTEKVKAIVPDVKVIEENEFYTEYSALIIKTDIVDNINEAVFHINKYGTHHSDGIITENKDTAETFVSGVDSGAVYVNASTRFTDGNEFGLGAEMGISTQKLHARGPIGLKELTSLKYVIRGQGQIRV